MKKQSNKKIYEAYHKDIKNNGCSCAIHSYISGKSIEYGFRLYVKSIDKTISKSGFTSIENTLIYAVNTAQNYKN